MEDHKDYTNKHEDVIDEIQKGLHQIDQNINVTTPDLRMIQQWVENEQQILKKEFIKELVTFLLVAIVVVSMVLFMFMKAPIFYFLLQIVAMAIIFFYSGVFVRKKQVDKG